jgi:eukaryotic-like serine/threonine-protein kinase
MAQLRERWEGVALPGDYLLQQWLGGDEAAGFFETSLPSDGRRAVVKLVPELAGDGAAQLALWRRTRVLRHPNLCELLDCGRAELAGEIVVYAVMEYADDTLASALARSPLSEAEAREVLDAVLSAMGYLHAQGLAYPALDPANVVAVGEAIKLSTDALREAAADTPYTAEVHAFWSRISPSTPARSAEIFAQALGAGPQSGPAPVPAPVEIAPAAPKAAPPVPPARDFPPPEPKRFPKWVLVGAAGVVLLIFGLNLRHAPEVPAQPEPPAPGPAPVVAAPAVPKPSPVAEAIATPPSKPASEPAPAGMWRVIVFTYRTREAAAAKAEQINERHPELQATVLQARGKKGDYRIVLGGPMSREDAERLQQKARAARVARDVYLQNDLD